MKRVKRHRGDTWVAALFVLVALFLFSLYINDRPAPIPCYISPCDTESCSTDTECMELNGGDGGPGDEK